MAMVETVFGAIAKHALVRPSHPALIADARVVSYAELMMRIREIAAAIAALVPAKARVCIETNDPVGHFAASVAVMLKGGVAVALPNDSADAYASVLHDADPVMTIANGESRFPRPEGVVIYPVESLRGSFDGNASMREPATEDIAMIYYTSGTTSGIRKGVLQSYRALEATARYISSVMKLTEEAVEYVASPMDNAFWFGRLRVLMHVGGTALVSVGSLNPLKILSALKQHGGNAISGDTPVFTLFLHHMAARLRAIGPEIRWAKVASQAMAIADKRALIEHLPRARIVMNYGLTEAMRTCLLPFEDHPNKLESVGRSSPGVSVRIVGQDGEVLPANGIGEIQVSGPNVASGYLNKQDLWDSRYRAGWYATGDLGHIDEDGFVYIQGRKDEAINVGGRTVSPLEVERYLAEFLPGRKLAVVGFPDASNVLGDVVALVIEGGWDLDTSWPEFRVRLFENMPPSFVPREAFTVPSLPRTGNAKVQRRELSALVQAGQLTKL